MEGDMRLFPHRLAQEEPDEDLLGDTLKEMFPEPEPAPKFNAKAPGTGTNPYINYLTSPETTGLSLIPPVLPSPDLLAAGGYNDAEIIKTLAEIDEDWTGRVVFWFDEVHPVENRIGLGCGPETNDGDIDDTWDGGVRGKLIAILGESFWGQKIGESENHYVFNVSPGSILTTIRGIRDALAAAGAVCKGSPMP